jgi:endonuclease/exonuclease/phosphatase family metal-dependent hydrolase
MPDTPLIGRVEAPDLQIMSFNIRRRMPSLMHPGQDRWTRRQPLIARLLRAERPTIVGVQEALPDQANFVRHVLGERYRSVGYGRNADKRGEGCPLYWDNERLHLLSWKQTALSDTPLVPGSSTWGNRTPRVVVNATFEDRKTGIHFQAVNTHLDNSSRRSRLRASDALLAMIEASGLPAVLTGDFNTDGGTLPHDRLMASGALVDSWIVTPKRLSEAWGTFPNYRAPKLERKRIDWILASPTIEVVSAGINVTRFDGGWPSDHTPVQAVLRLPGAAPVVA